MKHCEISENRDSYVFLLKYFCGKDFVELCFFIQKSFVFAITMSEHFTKAALVSMFFALVLTNLSGQRIGAEQTVWVRFPVGGA